MARAGPSCRQARQPQRQGPQAAPATGARTATAATARCAAAAFIAVRCKTADALCVQRPASLSAGVRLLHVHARSRLLPGRRPTADVSALQAGCAAAKQGRCCCPSGSARWRPVTGAGCRRRAAPMLPSSQQCRLTPAGMFIVPQSHLSCSHLSILSSRASCKVHVRKGATNLQVGLLICNAYCLQLPHSRPLQLAGGDQQAGLCAVPRLGAASFC